MMVDHCEKCLHSGIGLRRTSKGHWVCRRCAERDPHPCVIVSVKLMLIFTTVWLVAFWGFVLWNWWE